MALVTNLATQFSKYVSDEEDEEGDSGAAAEQCLTCIATVLHGVSEREEIFHSLEPILIKLIELILAGDRENVEYERAGERASEDQGASED